MVFPSRVRHTDLRSELKFVPKRAFPERERTKSTATGRRLLATVPTPRHLNDSTGCLVSTLAVLVRIGGRSSQNPSPELSALCGFPDDNAAMHNRQLSRLRKLAFLAILLSPPLLAWSDGAFPHSSESEKTCYCGCDMKAGTPMCMHVCELPKYSNRPWASSCKKKRPALGTTPSPQSGTHSRKTNRVQDARL